MQGTEIMFTQTLAEKQAEYITQWNRDWFDQNGPAANAVIGISGGKDSTIAAALLVKALGPDRVIGVLMPNGIQKDINDAKRVVEFLGIKSVVVNIEGAVNALTNSLENHIPVTGTRLFQGLSQNSKINLPPRIRMATLYAVAQSLPNSGMVCNTCNASEDYIGYSTKYGDAAGDFAPLQSYTATEILAIGHALGLPADLVDKTPSDGLCGVSDEDRFGFSYAVLDRFIRTGQCDDDNVKRKIIQMHNANLHKLRLIPACPRLEAA